MKRNEALVVGPEPATACASAVAACEAERLSSAASVLRNLFGISGMRGLPPTPADASPEQASRYRQARSNVQVPQKKGNKVNGCELGAFPEKLESAATIPASSTPGVLFILLATFFSFASSPQAASGMALAVRR